MYIRDSNTKFESATAVSLNHPLHVLGTKILSIVPRQPRHSSLQARICSQTSWHRIFVDSPVQHRAMRSDKLSVYTSRPQKSALIPDSSCSEFSQRQLSHPTLGHVYHRLTTCSQHTHLDRDHPIRIYRWDREHAPRLPMDSVTIPVLRIFLI